MHGHDIGGLSSLTAALEPGVAPMEPGACYKRFGYFGSL